MDKFCSNEKLTHQLLHSCSCALNLYREKGLRSKKIDYHKNSVKYGLSPVEGMFAILCLVKLIHPEFLVTYVHLPITICTSGLFLPCYQKSGLKIKIWQLLMIFCLKLLWGFLRCKSVKFDSISSDYFQYMIVFVISNQKMIFIWMTNCYSCNKITKTWIQISRQNWNGYFSNASHQIMI